MPAMPIAESSAPIVVGISATSSAISTVCESRRAGVDRERLQRDDGGEEGDRQPGEQDVERDLVRRLAPLGALDERDHAVEERLARLLRDLDHEPVGEQPRAAGDGRAVAAGLADHRRRLAGDRRLVDRADALDDLAVGRDDLARLDDDDVAALQLGRRDVLERAASRRAGARSSSCASRAARSPAPCRGPRRSPRRSSRTARSARARSRSTPTNQSSPVSPRARSRKKIPVVITLPSSTMNITGFVTCSRGSSFGNESRIAASDDARARRCSPTARAISVPCSRSSARLSSSTFTPGSPKKPERAAVGVRRRSAAAPSRAAGAGRRRSRRACSCA